MLTAWGGSAWVSRALLFVVVLLASPANAQNITPGEETQIHGYSLYYKAMLDCPDSGPCPPDPRYEKYKTRDKKKTGSGQPNELVDPYIDLGDGCSFVWGATYFTLSNELIPTYVLIKRTLNNVTGSINIEIAQTAFFTGGELYEMTPNRTVTSQTVPYSGGYNGSTYTYAANALFQASQAVQTVDYYKTGLFQLKITPKAGGGPAWVMNFIVRSRNQTGFSTTDPTSTGGNPAEGANGTAAQQTTFWNQILSGAFVPSQTSMNNLKAAGDQFRNWGPFGIATAMATEMQNKASSLPGGTCPYCITVGNSNFTGPITADLTPMAAWLRVVRALILMVLIWSFGWSLIRWVTKSRASE